MATCDARIRPFPNVTEIACELEGGHQPWHKGTLRDYAYPGSETVVKWEEGDRRTFHGEWPGDCPTPECVLPVNHHGGHIV